VESARRAARQAAPTTHLQHGAPEQLECALLRTATRLDLLACDEMEFDQRAL
jgi:hypothetical protein